jgi:hypothetical protein
MLTFKQRQQIYTEVVLGSQVALDESDETKELRSKLETEVAAIRAKGLMPDAVFDPDGDYEGIE